MYAIIEVGAKQYSVKKDDLIEVVRQEAAKGKEVVLSRVLMVSKEKKIEIGQPHIKDASVKAEVVRHIRGPKTISFKYRRRKGYHKTTGHRQDLSVLKIKEIVLA